HTPLHTHSPPHTHTHTHTHTHMHTHTHTHTGTRVYDCISVLGRTMSRERLCLKCAQCTHVHTHTHTHFSLSKVCSYLTHTQKQTHIIYVYTVHTLPIIMN